MPRGEVQRRVEGLCARVWVPPRRKQQLQRVDVGHRLRGAPVGAALSGALGTRRVIGRVWTARVGTSQLSRAQVTSRVNRGLAWNMDGPIQF
jgi:hypothetical protein